MVNKGKVVVASTAGFCFGVRRAITLAEKTAQHKEQIYTLGPLIHNPQEINRLAKRGIVPVKSPAHVKKSHATVVVRTHGIPSSLRATLEKKKLCIVDATCPFVKRAQEIVQRLHRDGYQIIIAGDRTHPEVIGLVSYAGKQCRVVENKNDLKKLSISDKIGVVSQTTQTPENFTEIINELKQRAPEAKIYNTICRATIDRQTEAKRLAGKADVMVVVGGKNSGNTRRLYELCQAATRTHAIETASELDPAWFRQAKVIGISAGASTPDWIIKEVKAAIDGYAHAQIKCKSSPLRRDRR